MSIDKLPDFATDPTASKGTDNLNLPLGFPSRIRPARQWFNYLFNATFLKINEVIDKKLDNSATVKVSGAVNGSAVFDGSSTANISVSANTDALRVVTGNNYTITYDDARRIAIIEMSLWTNDSVVNQTTGDNGRSNCRVATFALPITLKKRMSSSIKLSEEGATAEYFLEAMEWLVNVMYDGYRGTSAQTQLCARFSRWTGMNDEPITAKAIVVGIF
ncbi:hypothetical protein P256_00684 [Acinetobacter nectaris CIP 110549]|uniref:Uncharacterized protein n=1 Tax=Acinetobacter nectaris CIP 110549 TaxID=1392540 RepID=V2TRN4_9GAMM|nr:hypothetical protein [Acinetobacter nectaris]ESK40237.1 hypothetical protein P256_00684 [Acinetobacter nectaris CIP 110549]